MFSRRVITFALFLLLLLGIGSCATPPKEDAKDADKNTPDDGYIRLVLNEKKGHFSLYYLSDPKTMRYKPLFNSNDPSSSFLSVYMDGNVYRLGNSRQFKTRIEKDDDVTALVFESSFLKVTQIFTPVKTLSSQAANGVMITVNIQNNATQRSFVGLRMLFDTELGEGRKKVPFITNTQIVTSELLLEGNSNEKFWITRGKNIALMGSIVNPDGIGKGPDIVHIANWKRLKDAPWRLSYSEGRSFNNLPYSAGDSAVCYYFGPEMLDHKKVLSYTVFLTTEDVAWYNSFTPPTRIATAPSIVQPPGRTSSEPIRDFTAKPIFRGRLSINIPAIEAEARREAAAKHENVNIVTLLKLQEIINQFLNGQILLNEMDLTEIEKAIERHRN
jgi:hypothetical protein